MSKCFGEGNCSSPLPFLLTTVFFFFELPYLYSSVLATYRIIRWFLNVELLVQCTRHSLSRPFYFHLTSHYSVNECRHLVQAFFTSHIVGTQLHSSISSCSYLHVSPEQGAPLLLLLLLLLSCIAEPYYESCWLKCCQ